MRVLVTGATGFLGGQVARRLKAQGHEVLATGRNGKVGAQLADVGISFARADLAERQETVGIAQGCDCVVHAAALSSPWGDEASFVRANLSATDHLLAEIRDSGVRRLVHISTPSIYMGAGSRLNVKEDSPLPPFVNAYARTKWLAERRVLAAAREGLEVVVLRPRALFGPGDTTIFPRLLRALEKGRLPIIGSGENVVDLTYIDNAVDAVELSCRADARALGGVYNISNGEPVSLWSVIARLATALGYRPPRRKLSREAAMAVAWALERASQLTRARPEPPLTRYSVSVLADSMTLDISKAQSALGYHPQVSVDQGLTRFISSLQGTP